MVAFTPLTRAEMDRRHAAARLAESRTPHTAPPPAPRNVAAILDLGNATYFLFRGRAYGVPPLPYPAGLQLLEAKLALECAPERLDAASLPAYRATVARLPALLWRCAFPVSRSLRLLRTLGLLRNPLERATEGELGELLDFFLLRRTKSGIGFPPARTPSPAPPT